MYLDVLLAFAGGLCVGADAAKHHREMQRQKGLLKLQTVIYQEFPNIEGYEIIEHDVEALKKQLNEQFEMNCDLQDYIANLPVYPLPMVFHKNQKFCVLLLTPNF